MTSQFEHERVIKETPSICWVYLLLTNAAWLSVKYDHGNIRYFISGNLQSFLIGLLFPGFSLWHLFLNLIGAHMATWYILKSRSISTRSIVAIILTYAWFKWIDAVGFQQTVVMTHLVILASVQDEVKVP